MGGASHGERQVGRHLCPLPYGHGSEAFEFACEGVQIPDGGEGTRTVALKAHRLKATRCVWVRIDGGATRPACSDLAAG